MCTILALFVYTSVYRSVKLKEPILPWEVLADWLVLACPLCPEPVQSSEGYIWVYVWEESCGHSGGNEAFLGGIGIRGVMGRTCCCMCWGVNCWVVCSFSAFSWYFCTSANASFVNSLQTLCGKGRSAWSIQSTQACFSELPWSIAASILVVRSTACFSVFWKNSSSAVSTSFFCFFVVGAWVIEAEGSLSSSSSSTWPSWDPCGRCTMCSFKKPKFVCTHFCLAVSWDLFCPLFFL